MWPDPQAEALDRTFAKDLSMYNRPSTTDDAIKTSASLCDEARWDEAGALLKWLLRSETDKVRCARLKIALTRVYDGEDWSRGLRDRVRKHALLDEVDQVAGNEPCVLLADALFQRGTALHLEFIMAEGDPDRELECLSRAAELYEAHGDRENAALATAFVGIFHHVDRLDRDTAEPLLRRAYDMSLPEASHARSEAARHLGQIVQERGDAVGAIPLLEESLRQRAEAGQSRYLAAALHALGFAWLEAGDFAKAQDYLQRARENGERYGNRFFLTMIARTETELAFTRYLGPSSRGRYYA
ncbi:MAG: tetratricopeptide repeat protein [Actinoallomurus sp.]